MTLQYTLCASTPKAAVEAIVILLRRRAGQYISANCMTHRKREQDANTAAASALNSMADLLASTKIEEPKS